MKKFYIFLLFLFVNFSCIATHIVGGEITVQHVSGNTFDVSLHFYRDCSPTASGFSNPIEIGLFDKTTNALIDSFKLDLISVTPLSLGDPCYLPNMCVEEGLFRKTVTIQNNTNGYYLSLQLCCRNNIVQNIVSPLDAGIAFYSEIPDPAIINSSPVFGAYSKTYFCAGTSNTANFGALDADGDSLVYSLVTPLNGNATALTSNPASPTAGPYSSVVWQAPFAINNILGGATNLYIDPVTGIITVNPTTIGTFVFAVKVEEYRNGVKIGEITRDIQYQIVSCNNPLTPGPASSINCTNTTTNVSVSSSSAVSSYTWSGPGIVSGNSTSSATVNAAGTYTVTVLHTNGCTSSTTVSVTAALTPTVTVSGTAITCNGANNGSVSANATGGFAPYTYSWSSSPVQNTAVATNLSAGTYTCTVTDNNGCTVTGTSAITEPTALAINISSHDASCNSLCNGSAKAIVSGATAAYSYSWNTIPAQITDSISGLCAGTYIVTVTDDLGCSKTASTIISTATAINTTISATNLICNGSTNSGSATIIANGGTGNYSYFWNTTPSQTTATAINLATGTYNCTVTDANACTSTNTITINQPNALNATISSFNNASCNAQCNGTATVSVSGGAPTYAYSWNTNPVQTNSTATGLCAGTYVVTVTDLNGCTASASLMITEPTTLVSNVVGANAICNGAFGSATVNVNGGTMPYSYSWNTNPLQTSNSATNLVAGTYTCTITDVNACTTTTTVTINEPTPLVATISSTTNVTCNGLCNGVAVATASGATPPYSYSWSTTPLQTTPTISGLCAGTYAVTVSDINGCIATVAATITQQLPLTSNISSNNVLCNGGATGTVSITANGGLPTYSFLWTTSPAQTNSTANNLSAGSYTCTITDANGCTATNTVTISEPTQINAAIGTTTNVSCYGACDGNAAVVSSGGTPIYSYSWNSNPIQTNTIAAGLCAGNYTVTVTDINGCTASAIATIRQPNALTSIISSTGVTCNSGNNGSATIIANGGTQNYSYSWSTNPIQTTTTATNLSAGAYTCTITDANGCVTTNVVKVNEPAPLVATISSTTNITCNGLCNGSAAVTVSGSTPTYTYSWNTSPVQTSSSISGLCQGVYSVVVTDMNGCTASATTGAISEPTPLATNILSTNISCNGINNGSATITANGGTPNYSYNWNSNPVQTTNTANNLSAGTYTCTITDANGCTKTNTITISQPNGISVNVTTSNVTCFGLCDGATSASTTGGLGSYSYSWNSAPLQNTANASGLCAGNYTVTITDDNGCTKTATALITQPASALSSSIISISHVSCNAGSNGSATVIAQGGSGSYSYSWSTSPIQAGPTAINLTAGLYACNISDKNGCTVTNTITINQPTSISLATGDITTACDDINSASVIVSGGSSPYSYMWNSSPMQTTQAATNIAAGTYTVTVTDGRGCTKTHSVTIVNNYVTPTPGFTVSPASGSVNTNALFSFTDNSSNANSWHWDFADGSTSIDQHPVHTYADTGSYCITQTVINMPSGCKSKFVHCIKVEADWTFYIPNAFTPNNDGLNDYFGGRGTGIEKYKMIVFDRWGDEIFVTHDINVGWSGIANKGNEIAQQDVYSYIVYLTDIKNVNHKYMGHFTLVK